jgi:hypothetical protein
MFRSRCKMALRRAFIDSRTLSVPYARRGAGGPDQNVFAYVSKIDDTFYRQNDVNILDGR